MMKNKILLTLLFFAGTLGLANAQCDAAFYFNSGPYNVGDTIQFHDSTSASSGVFYSWSFGDGSYSGNNGSTYHAYSTAGTYVVCLTISDSARMCFDTFCDTIVINGTGGKSCKANFSTNVRGSVASFYNTSAGSGASYSWSYGDGSSSITSAYSHSHTYARAGTYKVTLIQTTSSCSDTICDSVVISNSVPCKAGFYTAGDSLDSCKTIFVSSSQGTNSSTMYSWAFGDGQSGSGVYTTHSYTTSGWVAVCLTISDSSRSCYDTYCDSVYVNGCSTGGNKCTLSVSGQVFTGRSFATSGIVYLIEKRGNNLFAVDTSSIDSMGSYGFYGVCPGDYFVKAALYSRDANYTDYLPTYYGTELKWDKATLVTVPSSKSGVNIPMILGTNTGGPGFIGGNVRKGANKKEGEPLEGIEIAILDKDLQAVAYVYSELDGSFELPGLAYGMYQVVVDIPGLPVNEFWVELKEDDSKLQVLVEVSSDAIKLSLDGFVGLDTFSDVSSSFSVYPNPADAFVNFTLEGFTGTVQVFDIAGKSVLMESISDNSNTINISELPTGWYQIKIAGVQNKISVLGTATVVKK